MNDDEPITDLEIKACVRRRDNFCCTKCGTLCEPCHRRLPVMRDPWGKLERLAPLLPTELAEAVREYARRRHREEVEANVAARAERAARLRARRKARRESFRPADH